MLEPILDTTLDSKILQWHEKLYQILSELTLVWFWFKGVSLELVSKELNHFGVIADLFRQIGGHSKGQLISKCLLGVIVSTKKPTKFL